MGDKPSFLFTCTSNSAKNGARRQLHQRQLSAYLSVTSNLDKTAVFDAPEMIMDWISVSTEGTACQGTHTCWLGHKWHKNSICNYLFSTKDYTLPIHTKQSALSPHLNMQYTALSFITIHMQTKRTQKTFNNFSGPWTNKPRSYKKWGHLSKRVKAQQHSHTFRRSTTSARNKLIFI